MKLRDSKAVYVTARDKRSGKSQTITVYGASVSATMDAIKSAIDSQSSQGQGGGSGVEMSRESNASVASLNSKSGE